MSCVEWLQGIFILICIIASVVMSGFMLINGSLSRRSVCYALMVFGISIYSVYGWLWITGSEELIESTLYNLTGRIAASVLIYTIFLAFLSTVRLSKGDFIKVALAAAAPFLILSPRWFILFNDLSIVFVSVDGHAGHMGSDIAFLHSNIEIFVYIIMAFACAIVSLRSLQGSQRKHMRTALIGMVVAFLGYVVFNALGNHSWMYVSLFMFVFMSYKAFSDDVGDDTVEDNV